MERWGTTSAKGGYGGGDIGEVAGIEPGWQLFFQKQYSFLMQPKLYNLLL